MNNPPAPSRLLIDRLIRFAMMIVFGAWAGVCLRSGLDGLKASDLAHLQAVQIGTLLSIFSVGLYNLVVAFLYIVRLKPVNKFVGILPSAAAIVGGFMMMGLVLLKPNDDLPLWLHALSCVMIFSGNGLAALIMTRLGKSFSILPEGRRVVTQGPYAIVRHPLYLVEEIATLGVMINYFSVGAVLLTVTQFGLQLVRMHYEEKVLKETFPAYADYAKRTWRLVPGIY